MMTSLVACDSSFMIKSLYSFRIPGVDYDFSINTTHVAMLLVSLFILIVAIIARVKINKANASDTPGMFQNIIELVIEMLGSMVDGIMGKNCPCRKDVLKREILFEGSRNGGHEAGV